VAISKKFGLPVPDLVKRMTAGRFRVKANIDAATADAYARSLEEVGARVKVEEAHPTPPSVPVVAAPPPPVPAAASVPVSAASLAEPPRKKGPTLPGEKPSRSGRYSVNPPRSSSSTAVPPPRSKSPSAAPNPAPSPPPAPPPREGHPSSTLMPVAPADAAAARAAKTERSGSTSLPPATERSGSTSLPPANAPRAGSSSLPPATERSGSTSLPPANAARTSSPSLSPTNAKNAPFQSGLSAAYSQEIPVAADLGSLGSLSLSSLDGNDDSSPAPSGSFGPPSTGMPASIGPAPEPAVKFTSRSGTTPAAGTPAKPPSAQSAPLDMFAPPDAEEAEQNVELAVDERPKKQTTAPARSQTSPVLAAPTPPAMRRQAHSQGTVAGGVSAPEMPRARIAAGVGLAIILGFIPAHLIASMREDKAFQKIDAQIVATQTAADTPEMYAALDSFRAAQLARKESERRSIALTSMLIWGVVAVGLGYVWFRRIPWDRVPGA